VFGPGALAALWVTERASRISVRAVDDAFAVASRAAGLPAELDLHCLRPYVSHLTEDGVDRRFIQVNVVTRRIARRLFIRM